MVRVRHQWRRDLKNRQLNIKAAAVWATCAGLLCILLHFLSFYFLIILGRLLLGYTVRTYTTYSRESLQNQVMNWKKRQLVPQSKWNSISSFCCCCCWFLVWGFNLRKKERRKKQPADRDAVATTVYIYCLLLTGAAATTWTRRRRRRPFAHSQFFITVAPAINVVVEGIITNKKQCSTTTASATATAVCTFYFLLLQWPKTRVWARCSLILYIDICIKKKGRRRRKKTRIFQPLITAPRTLLPAAPGHTK